MSIFDIFSFKKDAGRVFTKQNFEYVLKTARDAIVAEVKSNIPGQEKKNVVDAIVLAKIDSILLSLEVKNKIVLWLIERVKAAIPAVTQLIYDFLKEKIENL